jgi:hypothetical protein
MLNIGRAHPDFTYPNDLSQAKLTLWLLLPAAIISCVLIVLAVGAM